MGKRESGLTLLELIVTLVVAGILMAVAIPGFRSLMANNRAVAQSNALLTALNLARSEAVKRGTTVTVCPKSTANVNSTTCGANSGDWANGWFVFTDGGTVATVDGTDEVIRHWEPLSGEPTMTKDLSSSKPNYFQFASDGTKSVSGDETLELQQAGAIGDHDRCIHVSTMGLIRVQRMKSGDTCP